LGPEYGPANSYPVTYPEPTSNNISHQNHTMTQSQSSLDLSFVDMNSPTKSYMNTSNSNTYSSAHQPEYLPNHPIKSEPTSNDTSHQNHTMTQSQPSFDFSSVDKDSIQPGSYMNTYNSNTYSNAHKPEYLP